MNVTGKVVGKSEAGFFFRGRGATHYFGYWYGEVPTGLSWVHPWTGRG